MWSDAYTYLELLVEKYQTVAGIVVPSVLAGWGLILLERFKQFAGPRADSWVHVGRWVIALCAVFIVGFMAWRDEHDARMKSENEHKDLLARHNAGSVLISRIDISIGGYDSSQDVFKVRFANNAQIPAQLYSAALSLQYVEKSKIDLAIAATIMAQLEKAVIEKPSSISLETQILPNHWQEYSISPASEDGKEAKAEDKYQNFLSGDRVLFLAVAALYKDESLFSENSYRMVRYRSYYLKGNLSNYSLCPGENRTKTIAK